MSNRLYEKYQEIIGDPDYSSWAKMDYWTRSEVVLLFNDIKPYKEINELIRKNEGEDQRELREQLKKNEEADRELMESIERDEEEYENYGKYITGIFNILQDDFYPQPKEEYLRNHDEIPSPFWNEETPACERYRILLEQDSYPIISDDKRKQLKDVYDLVDRAEKSNELHRLESDSENDECFREGCFKPYEIVKWAQGREINIPVELANAVMKYHKEPGIPQDDTENRAEELTGEERRELGILREEKKKWDLSVKAAVYATLQANSFLKNKGQNITRDELKDKLYKDFPSLIDSSFEKIWKALREKDLTKGSGRPKNP